MECGGGRERARTTVEELREAVGWRRASTCTCSSINHFYFCNSDSTAYLLVCACWRDPLHIGDERCAEFRTETSGDEALTTRYVNFLNAILHRHEGI
ncbi:hypothetical protein NDU88_004133 [Pleurodeles waltl]|uniref:Uncharacterized protein n=1 Tax=Pleurodeles waltl TaxID=8319 RepID=A0AAV7SHY1_PLEWA|nr:hypothetical protein NDU88_004133 [Pleurodeles waltl]